jgi:DNA-binding GntR family transcriptional regulator
MSSSRARPLVVEPPSQTLDGVEINLSSPSVARQVATALRDAIVRMKIKPGERLSENDIAARFKISRSPAREAFIILHEAGLVRILPQRGTVVVKISVTAVENARFIREAVECAVVREVAAAQDRHIVRLLTRNLQLQRMAMRDSDADEFFSLDEQFHKALANAVGRSTAWRTLDDLKAQMDRVRFLKIADPVPMKAIFAQHQEILDAIAAGDPARAQKAMSAHLKEITSIVPKIAERYPDMFEAG